MSIKEIKTEIGREKEQRARQACRAKMSWDDLHKEEKEKNRRRSREQKEKLRLQEQEKLRRLQIEQDRAAEIVALLTERFGDDLPKLLELLSKTSWYKVQDRLRSA